MFHKRLFGLVLVATVLLLLAVGQADAQRRRTPRRPTPATSQPSTVDPQIISTADDDPDTASTGSRRATRPRTTGTEPPATTVSGLTQQVNTLNQRIARMEASQRALVDLEKLSRAEARADTLRAQLFAAQDRESALQSRIGEIDIELQPENLDNSNNLNGSTRPELFREQRKRYLESERAKAAAQLAQSSVNRNRLEGAVASADALVDKLRRAVDAETAGSDLTAGDTPDTNAPPARETAPPAAPSGNGYEPPGDDEEVPSDKELARLVKSALTNAGITTVQVEAANGAVILTGDVTSAQVPAALQAAYDARPRKIYNQMTVK
jgi:hypothetical protein